MKKSYSNKLRSLAVWLYEPIILRVEKYRALRMWKKGVRECEAQYSKIGRPRFYLLYNQSTHKWMVVTYDRRKDAVSLKQLVSMGKLRVKHLPSVQELKNECFYYTRSKWGAKGCETNELKQKKLAQWMNFYLYSVSTSYAKLHAYKKKYGL